MIEFKELLDFCQAEAIANKLRPTEDSVWRAICRSYSKMFHTPLVDVLDMDPEHVVLHVYEEQLDEVDDDKYENLEKMLDTILTIEDPEYERIKNERLEEDIAKYEAEEEERIRLNKPIHPALAKPGPLDAPTDLPPEAPKSGSIDLSYLEDEDEN